MALKTNSKKAKQNIHNYIRNTFDYINDCYTVETDLSDFHNLCAKIWEIFEEEKAYSIEYMEKMHMTYQDVFTDWAQGLALNIFEYYYNVSAVDLLGEMLEETEEERAKYTEEQAETMITRLIYREITANK